MTDAPARARGRERSPVPASRRRAAYALLLGALLLDGCAGTKPLAPVGRAPQRGAGASITQGVHTVRSGDTLYAIAWRYGLDYRDLARWNAVPEPYTIHVGQALRISRPSRLPPMPRSQEVATAPVPVPAPRARREPRRAEAAPAAPRTETRAPASAPRTARASAPRSTDAGEGPVSAWRWPVRGNVVATFGRDGGKGIDISGERGAPIVASAPGRVVYSGSGLRGYGRLIIVKHNKRYLSAYAHNDRLHVDEGDVVKSGQRIADMGSSDTKRVKLHFEIRRDGKPVDPIRHLPR